MIYRMKDAAKCDWRNPVFRVYRKGKLLQVGTAKELQLLFNKRHRQLKQELIQQVKMDDESQWQFEFQVELDCEYQASKVALMEHAEQVRLDTQPKWERPDDLEEECAWFQPNTEEKLERLRKQRCRYRRYRMKKLLPERIAAAKEAPELSTFIYSDKFEIEVPYGTTPDYIPREDTPTIYQRQPGGGIDWKHKRTPIEEQHIKEKKKRMGIRDHLYI